MELEQALMMSFDRGLWELLMAFVEEIEVQEIALLSDKYTIFTRLSFSSLVLQLL